MRAKLRQWADVVRRGGTDGVDTGYGGRWEYWTLAALAGFLLLLCFATWFRAAAPGVYGSQTQTGWGSHGIAGPVLLVGGVWLVVFGAGVARGGWGARRLRVTPSDLGHGALAVGGLLTLTYLWRLASPPEFAQVTTSTYGIDTGIDESTTNAITTSRTAAVWFALLIAVGIFAIGARLVIEIRGKVQPHQLWRAFGTDAVLRDEPTPLPAPGPTA